MVKVGQKYKGIGTVLEIDGPDVLVKDEKGNQKWIGLSDFALMGEPDREDFPKKPNKSRSGYYDDLDFGDESNPFHHHN